MKEDAFQSAFLDLMARNHPEWVYAPHVQLRCDIDKHSKGKDFTMPDTIPDPIELDEENNFHLLDLWLISSSEVWSGKFFGQMMPYHLPFTTEPWNELAGRDAFSGQKPDFRGEADKKLIHLNSYGGDEVADESDQMQTSKYGIFAFVEAAVTSLQPAIILSHGDSGSLLKSA